MNRPKHKTIRNAYKRIKFRLGIDSCISRGNSNDTEKQLDTETVHYATNNQSSVGELPTSSSSYTEQHQPNSFFNEFHENIEHRITETTAYKANIDNDSSLTPITNEIFHVEIDELSLANRNLSDQLQSVRSQLSDNLNRVRDFEERVKLIPKLQLELSVEKAENRDMHLKLKALENVLKKKEQNESRANQISTTEADIYKAKPFNAPQRVCATSLESLNIRFSSSSSPIESKQLSRSVSSQTKSPPSTHNVGSMTPKIISRDVGVTTIPVQTPTRTMAINTDISEKAPFQAIDKKPIMKNVSVQSDQELKPRTRTIATVTDREPIPPPIIKHSIGIMAVPNVKTNYCMAKPEVRSTGVDNIYQKIQIRSIGTDAADTILEKQVDSPVSLKLLDMPKTNIVPLDEVTATQGAKLKEFRSLGIQNSPNVSDKFIQCMEIKPSPKLQTHTESTDTNDLTILIHRGSNTDNLIPKRDCLTNTDRIVTEERSTNTTIDKNNTKHFGTNTDFDEDKINEFEHKCHNCLAKIEIKQRTIIKNPNKNQSVSNIASSSSMMEEIHSDELLNALQQSHLQSQMGPRSEKKFTRQNTYTITSPPIESHRNITTPCPAEAYLSSYTSSKTNSETHTSSSQISTHKNCDIENRTSGDSASPNANKAKTCSSDAFKEAKESLLTGTCAKEARYNEDEKSKNWSHSMKSSSTYSQLAASTKQRQKVKPSKEMQAALKVINDSLLKGQHLATTLKNANKIVQKEWFQISSTEAAQPFQVEDYLDYFEEYSPDIMLKYIVNLTDANGNTAMHYAVSHGNFDVVSILLDSKVCNINSINNAGYTCVMLVSLAKLDAAEHQSVVQRLFQIADVNVRAKKHNQTALMLAVSHGNYTMVRMLLDASADINIQDEDGSTALMCAAEHGHMNIIKILLAQPDCDSTIQDLDGSTALKISLEAGFRDIGVLLYAHEYMIKNKSPFTSIRSIGRSKPSSSLSSSSNALHGNPFEVSNMDSSKHT